MSGADYAYVRYFPEDWDSGTAKMGRPHRNVFFDICHHNWKKNAPMPRGELAMVVGDIPNWRELLADLMDAGKIKDSDEGYYNPKAMAEAQRAQDAYWQKRRAAAGGGRKSGETRKAKAATNEAHASSYASTVTSSAASPSGSSDGRADPAQSIEVRTKIDCLIEGAGAEVREVEPDSAADPPLVPTQEIERNSLVLYAGEPRPMLVGENEMECLQEVYAKGGVHDTGHYLAENLRYVREWAALGCDLNLDVLPAVQGKLLADEPEGVRSLKFYDGAVRSAYAKRMARENGTQPARRHTGARPANALAAAAFADLELSRVD